MEKPCFKDHFSGHSASYARFRPDYPDDLFRYLSGLTPATQLAWDCATGNGQAAIALKQHFDQVIATDASAQQIENARPEPGIDYRIEPAEQTTIPDHTVDLITVAQALHWFDFEAFFSESQRVLRDQGIIAIIAYRLLNIESDIDTVLSDFYHQTIGPYWPAERRYIDESYSSIPFPFEVIEAAAFQMSREWSLHELGGYLRTWSATQHYMQDRDSDPVVGVLAELESLWGPPSQRRTVTWPLILKIGRHTI